MTPHRRSLVLALVVALLAQIATVAPLPPVVRTLALLLWAAVVPGHLLVEGVIGRFGAPPTQLEWGVYTVAAGYGLLLGVTLLTSYLPGPLTAWQLHLAVDLVLAVLAVAAWRTAGGPGRVADAAAALGDHRAGGGADAGRAAPADASGLCRVSRRRGARGVACGGGRPGRPQRAVPAQKRPGGNPAACGGDGADRSRYRDDRRGCPLRWRTWPRWPRSFGWGGGSLGRLRASRRRCCWRWTALRWALAASSSIKAW